MVDDLFSDRFNLLLRVPNAKKAYKINTNSYLPNSTHRTPLALSMLEFVGRFMGMSLRTKACLPFDFPSIVWKYIVGDRPTFSDLIHIDAAFAEQLSRIRDCEHESVSSTGEAIRAIKTDEEFVAAYPTLRFTAFNCVGAEVELVPGGAELPVTLTNRGRYIDAALRFRLHEFDAQLAAIRRGLANVVPVASLALFTWREAEVLVSGSPTIDPDYLRKNTSYDGGYAETHDVIRRFWRVFGSFTHEQRSTYIRCVHKPVSLVLSIRHTLHATSPPSPRSFVWGRARLPPEGVSWTSRHKITRMSGGDGALPMAHTCFNTIDMPEYTTDERMRWALTTAMAYGIGGILNG